MKYRNIILMVVVAGMLSVTISCRNKVSARMQAQRPDPVNVDAYTVHEGRVVFYDSYPGTVVALNEVQIRSEVSGYVTRLYFTEGEHVGKGENLYEIDRTRYQAAFETAKANVAIAQANVEKAERDADRYRKLDEENAVAKKILDDALTALGNARLQLEAANAELTNAKNDFNHSLITAPFSGSIGFSQVKQGTFVNAGQTLLNTISSDDPMGVDMLADAKSLVRLKKIQENASHESDSTFRVVLADNAEYSYPGRLLTIDRAVDPLTGTIKVRVAFPNSKGELRPGMNCRIKVLSEYTGNQISVPAKSVSELMGEFFVWFIDSSGTVRQRRIAPGPSLGANLIVSSGLKPGDRIVVGGIQKVHEGTIVDISGIKKSAVIGGSAEVYNK